MQRSRLSRLLLLASLGAFLVAIIIHNRGGIDPAIVPGALFTALFFWKPRRVSLVLAAITLAGPAVAFLNFAALTDPARRAFFINHVFLLLTALLALGAVVVGLLPNGAAQRAVTVRKNP